MLTINLLGKPEIQQNGHPLPPWQRRKAAALLWYLVVTQRPHHREALAGLLWGELSEASARAQLRIALRELVTVLPDYIHVTHQTLAFNTELPYHLDLQGFEAGLTPLWAATSTADPITIRQAIALYRGDFLEGFYVKNAPAYEEWVITRREHLKQAVIQGLQWLVDQATASGDYVKGIHDASRLLALASWHETAHRQLMTLLALDGQRSAALKQFEQCKAALVAELGVEPAPETIALYQQIKAGALELAATLPPHNLPPPRLKLFGRESDTQTLVTRLGDDHTRLMTLVGIGGVGKTVLALAAARQLIPHFQHGIWFVPLAETPTTTPTEHLLTSIAGSLPVTFVAADNLQAQLLAYLRAKQTLLVLDNFEVIVDGKALLVTLLEHAPQLKILVTSRVQLNLQVEYPLHLSGLPLTPAENSSPAYAQLFADRAGRATAGQFALTPYNQPALEQICRLVDGLPLGLELAAAWTDTLTPAEIVTAIQDDLDFLTAPMPDLPTRHQSLRAVFAGAWRLLSPAEQQILAQMSVFEGPFSREAAQTIVGANLVNLASLLRKSLLQRPREGEYQLHPLVRQFATEKLAPQRQQIQARHGAYYLKLAAHYETASRGTEPQHVQASLYAALDNLRVASHWSIQTQALDILAESLSGLMYFLNQAGFWSLGLDILAQIIATCQTDEAQFWARVYLEQSRLLNEVGRFDEAIAAATHALDQTDSTLAAAVHLCRGIAFVRRGKYDVGVQALQQAQQIAEARQDAPVQMKALMNLGTAAFITGDTATARRYYHQSQVLAQQLGDQESLCRVLNNLGNIASDHGNSAAALNYYQQALAHWQKLNAPHIKAVILYNLGLEATRSGILTDAIDYYEQSLYLRRDLGSISGEGKVLSGLGAVYLHLGQYTIAEQHLIQALTLSRQVGNPRNEVFILLDLSRLAEHTEAYATALTHAEAALHLLDATGIESVRTEALIQQGHALAGLRRYAEAETAYRAVIEWPEAQPSHHLAVEAYAGLAHISRTQNDLSAAWEHIASLVSGMEIAHLNWPWWVYWNVYQILSQAGDDRAIPLLRHAYQQLQQQAERITDPTARQQFLQATSVRKALVDAYVNQA